MLNIILLLFIYVKTDPTKLTEYDQKIRKSTFLKSFFWDVGMGWVRDPDFIYRV